MVRERLIPYITSSPEKFRHIKDMSVPMMKELLGRVDIRIDVFDDEILGKINYNDYQTEMLVQMVRRVDVTGLIPNLIGVSRTAEDTAVILNDYSHSLANIIHAHSNSDEILRTLNGTNVSPIGVLLLDKLYGDLVGELKQTREKHPEALDYRACNCRQLYTALGSSIPMDELMRLQQKQQLLPIPVIYRPISDGKRVVDVRVDMHIPQPWNAENLASITPWWFRNNSEIKNNIPEYIKDRPIGYLYKLGIFGNPILRAVAAYLPKDPTLQSPEYIEQMAALAKSGRKYQASRIK